MFGFSVALTAVSHLGVLYLSYVSCQNRISYAVIRVLHQSVNLFNIWGLQSLARNLPRGPYLCAASYRKHSYGHGNVIMHFGRQLRCLKTSLDCNGARWAAFLAAYGS